MPNPFQPTSPSYNPLTNTYTDASGNKQSRAPETVPKGTRIDLTPTPTGNGGQHHGTSGSGGGPGSPTGAGGYSPAGQSNVGSGDATKNNFPPALKEERTTIKSQPPYRPPGVRSVDEYQEKPIVWIYSTTPVPSGPNRGMEEWSKTHKPNIKRQVGGTVIQNVGTTTYSYGAWGKPEKETVTFKTDSGLSSYQIAPGETLGINLKTGEMKTFNAMVPFGYGSVNTTTGAITPRTPTYRDVDFKTSFTGGPISQNKVSFQTYADYKITSGVAKLNPIGRSITDVAFYNIVTKQVDQTPAYNFLNKERSISFVNLGKYVLFAPYTATGTQTYLKTFGDTPVRASTRVGYISPIEPLKMSQALGEFSNTGIYKTVGQEFKKEGDSLFYTSVSRKAVGPISSLTKSTTEITATGADRLAGFTRGTTLTNIKGMSGTTYQIVNTFSASSRIVDIKLIGQGVYEGKMSGIYYQPGKVPISFDNIKVASYPTPESTTVMNYQTSRAIGVTTVPGFGKGIVMPIKYFDFMTPKVTGIGRIYAMRTGTVSTEGTGSFVSGGGGTKLGMLKTEGGIFATGVTNEVQKFSIFSSSGATFTNPGAFEYAYKTGLLMQPGTRSIQVERVTPIEQTRQISRQSLILMPSTLQRPIIDTAQVPVTPSRSIVTQTQIISPIQTIRTITAPRPITVIPNFNFPNGPGLTGGPGFTPLPLGFDDGLGTRKVKGKRRSKYTPDFPSLIFNIKGKATSGLGILKGRPIPKGFTWAFKGGKSIL